MNAEAQAQRDKLQRRLKLTAAVLLCSLLGLIFSTFMVARQVTIVRDTTAQEQSLYAFQAQLQAVLVWLTDAETGQRGFLLSGKDRYLDPYREAVRHLPETLNSLDALQLAEPDLAGDVARIRRLEGMKISELAETIRLTQEGNQRGASALLQTDSGQQYMEQLRSTIGSVDAQLRADQRALNGTFLSGSAATQRLAIITVSALVITVLLAALQISMLMEAQGRYQAALLASERQHRAIVEDQTEFIAICRADGSLEYVNPACAKFFQLPPAALAARSFYDFLAPADSEAVREQFNSVMNTGKPSFTECRVSIGSGPPRWIAWRHHMKQGPTGERLMQSIGRDVTVRRNAEEALRASQDFLARSGRVAGVGGWQFDLRTGAIHWSEQVKRIHEVPDDYVPTLLGAMQFCTPEARDMINGIVEQARIDGRSWDVEMPMITTSGREIWVRSVGEAELAPDGTPIRLVGALQDITERRALELRLQESERFIRAVTDNVPVRLAYFDRERRIQFVNRATCERLRRTRTELIGRPLSEVATKALDVALRAPLCNALDGVPQHFEHDDEIEGTTCTIDMHLIPDYGPNAIVRGAFAIGVDITHLKKAERALRTLTEVFDSTPDYVAQADSRGAMQYINPAARKALGLDPSEPLEGRVYSEFFPAEINERYLKEIIPAAKRAGSWVGESAVLLGGRTVPVAHMVIAHRDSSGRVARYSSIKRDISSEVAARHQLAKQTATLNAIIDAIPAMVTVCDADMRYRFVNRAYERWREKSRDEVIGHTVEEIIGSFEFQKSLPWVRRALAGETVTYEKEYPDARMRHASVSYIPLHLDDGSVGGLIAVVEDITSEREERSRLLRLNEHDPLTGLLNRAGFESYLKGKIEQGDGASLAALYIDLDYFKTVNDQHGHTSGDEVLRQFAERVQSVVRPSDAVARLGGDEFGVVLAHVRSADDAARVAGKIVEVARQPFIVEGHFLSIGASVGVAFNAGAEGGWKGLVARADAMVYQAKAAGRGRHAQAPGSETLPAGFGTARS